MGRHLITIWAVSAGLGALACTERREPTPPGLQASLSDSPPTCSFNAINPLVARYFSPTEAKVVKALIDQMQAAGVGTSTARDRGFDVMAHIAQNVKSGNTDVADASSLTNNLLICMFTSAADLPAIFPEDFSVATDPSRDGGYDVRGGSTDPLSDPVLSRPPGAPFSGIAPTDANTWPGVLGGNPAPKRILAYGKPGPNPQTYDWKIVPRTTTFMPHVMVGVCIDPSTATTDLLNEENKGLLPFVDVPFLVPGVCSSVASLSAPWPTLLARRLGEWGVALFGPRALSASSVMSPGGLGGSTGGIGSVFGPVRVDTVTLTFTAQPTDITVNQIITPAVVVLATKAGTTTPVPNVVISLSSLNNNGTPAVLTGTLTGTTNASGTVTFADLSETKTGGYLLVAVGSVNGRPVIAVPAVNSARFNVRP